MPKSKNAPVVQEADVVEGSVVNTALGAVNTSTGELVNEETGIMPVNSPGISDIMQSSIVPEFAISLEESKRRIELLKEFVRNQMVEGEDFGKIPGTSGKPTLFKPGAEKLNAIFGLAPIIEITSRVEDWDKGFVAYEVKVTLINKRTREIEAEGIGSCNSHERKYKSQDAANLANTILKMSKKRALIDATLSATRASGLFTQDVEDMAENGAITISGAARPASRPTRPAPAADNGEVRPWNASWRAKNGPCAEVKDDNGLVVKAGKTLEEMSAPELRWYYDQAVIGANKGGQYAAMDRGKVQFIKELQPDIESVEPIQYERPAYRR